MNDTGPRNGNWRGRLDAAVALSVRYLLSILGAVLTISGFVALVTAGAARVFVKEHPYPIYLALIVAVLIIMATLNRVYTLRRRCAELTARLGRRDPPSAHDVRFYAEVLTDIPVGGHVIAWLKRIKVAELRVTDVPADVLSALERTMERPRMRPVGFDDRETAAAFRALIGAVEEFRDAVERWTFSQHHARWSSVAARDAGAMTSALATSQARLIQAYDAFIVTAHAYGIDAVW